MDIQFVLDSYACAKYLMSYTTKPEREMSLFLEATHKECRERNMSVRQEMKKLTGTFLKSSIRQCEMFDARQQCTRRVKEIVYENRKKYEAHLKEADEIES
ncbi:unnamed protein product [Rotaria sp. Silwood2]|nr:unnamed protein product [Rotaria sp. Silwood2]